MADNNNNTDYKIHALSTTNKAILSSTISFNNKAPLEFGQVWDDYSAIVAYAKDKSSSAYKGKLVILNTDSTYNGTTYKAGAYIITELGSNDPNIEPTIMAVGSNESTSSATLNFNSIDELEKWIAAKNPDGNDSDDDKYTAQFGAGQIVNVNNQLNFVLSVGRWNPYTNNELNPVFIENPVLVPITNGVKTFETLAAANTYVEKHSTLINYGELLSVINDAEDESNDGLYIIDKQIEDENNQVKVLTPVGAEPETAEIADIDSIFPIVLTSTNPEDEITSISAANEQATNNLLLTIQLKDNSMLKTASFNRVESTYIKISGTVNGNDYVKTQKLRNTDGDINTAQTVTLTGVTKFDGETLNYSFINEMGESIVKSYNYKE